jgi:peroxiredoxin 2/4
MGVLVGKKAPSFKAKAVVNGGDFVENFSLDQYLGKKMVVFYFYPADFTFVCPTEIIAFQDKIAEFDKRNVAIVGCSVDSEFHTGNGCIPKKTRAVLKGLSTRLYPTVQKRSPKTMMFWLVRTTTTRMVWQHSQVLR